MPFTLHKLISTPRQLFYKKKNIVAKNPQGGYEGFRLLAHGLIGAELNVDAGIKIDTLDKSYFKK